MSSAPLVAALLAVTVWSGCTQKGDAKVGIGVGLGIALGGGALISESRETVGADVGLLLGVLIAAAGGSIVIGSILVVAFDPTPSAGPP